jgi:hypothetical protein
MTPRGAERWLPLLLILAAFGLRVYHLDYQSLWSDEGISLVRSSLPPGALLAQMPVEHVPGYFMLLKGWIALAGTQDFSLRYLSLLASVAAVPLLARLGMDLGSVRGGWLAAALLATNPFQVWYAQEARMYSWLLASGLLATVAGARLITRPRSGWGVWAVYVAATTATIYLHYFGFLVPLAHTAFALIWLLAGQVRRGLWRWAAAGVIVALLFAPWIRRAVNLLAFEGWRAPLEPLRVPWLLLTAYSVGETPPPAWAGDLYAWLPWLYAVLALLGLAAWTRRRVWSGVLLAALAGVSIAVVWLLVVRQPDFHVRYAIFISGVLLLLVAGGVAGLDPGWWGYRRRAAWLPGLAVAALIAAGWPAMDRAVHDASVQKPDYRGAAAAINAEVRPSDVVLVDGPNPELVFAHYYTGAATVYDLRPLADVSWEEVDRTLTVATAGAPRAWELLYFHAPGPVQVWLATHGWPAAPSDHNGIRVSLVGLAAEPLTSQGLGVRFGPALELVSAEVQPGAARGDLVRVTTHWQTHVPPPDYKFSLRLAGRDGGVALADDYVPQNWLAPTSRWAVGAAAEDRRGLWLPPDLPPGVYTVTLRLYDPVTGVAVETDRGQDVALGEVEVFE